MDATLVGLDLWVMVGTSVLFAGLLVLFGGVNRPVGVLFFVGYCAFILFQFSGVILEQLSFGSAAASG